jgi:hypothetical protein
MAHLASMMSAFGAAWSLLKARDDRMVHGRLSAPPAIASYMDRLREQGMLGETVEPEFVMDPATGQPLMVPDPDNRPDGMMRVPLRGSEGGRVPVNIQQVERSVAPLREDVETMMGGGGQMNPETGKIVDAGTPGAIDAMPTTTRKIPGFETMPEESYHTRGEQRLARDQMANVLGRTLAGQMGERTNIRGGSGAGVNNPMRQRSLRRRAANLQNVEGTVAGGGDRSLAFGTGEAGRAMEAHRAAQESAKSPTEAAMDALLALRGMPGVTIDESGVEPSEEFRPSQLSTTSGMETGSENLSSLGRRRKEMQDMSVFNQRMSPEQRQRLMELGGQLDPATMALLEGRGDPQTAMQGERRAQLLQDADAMARTESRAAQARADRS